MKYLMFLSLSFLSYIPVPIHTLSQQVKTILEEYIRLPNNKVLNAGVSNFIKIAGKG